MHVLENNSEACKGKPETLQQVKYRSNKKKQQQQKKQFPCCFLNDMLRRARKLVSSHC